MSTSELVVTLLGTLALIVNLIGSTSHGDTPNGLVGGAVIIFSTYLFIDFYAGLRHRETNHRC